MALAPKPVVLTQISAGNYDSTLAPQPLVVVGPIPSDPVNPVVAALIAAGFGAAGEVLATNSTGDGFEWVAP